jgi:hypothetical protein
MKQYIKIFGGAYLLGAWIYGLWYVWDHWAEANHIGTLAGHAIMRASCMAMAGGAGPDAWLTNARGHRPTQRNYASAAQPESMFSKDCTCPSK